ncbi:MAG: hypothetical protein IJR49_04080 [Treponema sp.]|nr:hypothetical protein [Treponema sp.]
MLTSCSPAIDGKYNYNENAKSNELTKTYYSRDTTKSFLVFLQNPEENVKASRTARAARSAIGEDTSLTENDMFAEIWESLTEEEKLMMSKNASSVEVTQDFALAVDSSSETGRAALLGDSSSLDALTELYRYNARLEDAFKNLTLPISFVEESFPPDTDISEVPAFGVVDNYIRNGNWEKVETILSYLNNPISRSELENLARTLSVNDTSNERASSVMTYYSTPLKENVGETLKDGTVLLTLSKKKAYVIAGNWVHGGIFSKDLYDKNSENISNEKRDSIHCVYTAQPNEYDDFPNDMKPDRPGYACLDTIYMYTKQRKFATLLPKNYSDTSARNAVQVAKEVYYDTWPKYLFPGWEIFVPFSLPIFDSSHDLTNKNTYCTKVVYTAWKKQGVDLDARTFAGNTVTPDDIYSSHVDRYSSFTLKIFWWTKTWTWKTYSATSNLLSEEHR